VSLQSLANLSPDKRRAAAAEAARVLRPGGAFVFIERVAASDRAPASPVRGLLTAGAADGGATLGLDELDGLRKGSPGVWEALQYDLALEGQDPHALGVAVRGDGRAPNGGGGSGGAANNKEKKRDKRVKPTTGKGF